jgi:transposase
MKRTRVRPRPLHHPAPATDPAGTPAAAAAAPAGPAAPPATPPPAGPDPSAPPTPIGVGIDTSRYGHYATFLRPDLQDAAPELTFPESAQGYAQPRARLQHIQGYGGSIHFHFRLDAAGQYAENLLAFLHALPEPKTISCGDPLRNKSYRVAVFGHKKSDPVESRAAARYALTERPRATPPLSPQLRLLRQIAGRLDAQVRQGTRLVNQLHNLLARTFPELALLTKDLSAGWVLQLLDRYPTAARLATARASTLQAIAYLPHDQIPPLLQQARTSVASLSGPLAEHLVRDQARQVRDAQVRQKSLGKMLVTAYRDLQTPNHLDGIKGIGAVTAAVLTAQALTIDRFDTPGHLVGYFGVFPVDQSSGIDRDGSRRAPKRMVMSPRGCDLVRRYLWTAALTAVQHNPAVRPLYLRVRAKHPDQPAIAIGHAMHKLLHLVFAVWKTGRPFDPQHYPWDQERDSPRSVPATAATATAPAPDLPLSRAGQDTRDTPVSVPPPATPAEPAAGHNPETKPEPSVVTAAGPAAPADAPPHRPAPSFPTGAGPWIDFAHLRAQLPLGRVLAHLGLLESLRGRGDQKRGPCPVHAPAGTGRTFSVHLGQNIFQCFTPACGIKGDVIDLWAALHQLPLRAAALELVQTFNLEPAPPPTPAPRGTEKRHG